MARQTTVPQGRNRYEPDQASPPGETLFDVFSERGWTLPNLAKQTGTTEAELRLLFRGELRLAAPHADRLARATGIDAEFWMAREANYRRQSKLPRMAES